jgi:hypothetical protein
LTKNVNDLLLASMITDIPDAEADLMLSPSLQAQPAQFMALSWQQEFL